MKRITRTITTMKLQRVLIKGEHCLENLFQLQILLKHLFHLFFWPKLTSYFVLSISLSLSLSNCLKLSNSLSLEISRSFSPLNSVSLSRTLSLARSLSIYIETPSLSLYLLFLLLVCSQDYDYHWWWRFCPVNSFYFPSTWSSDAKTKEKQIW